MIELQVDIGQEDTIQMSADSMTSNDVNMEADSTVKAGLVEDYNALHNKPTLNDVVIMGAMYESDPTVPQWAKEKNKPTYSTNELNAINADDKVPYEDIQNILNTIWS